MSGKALTTILAACLLALPAGAAPLFTHPPTDIGNAAGVIPLGNLNPSGGHVLPVDHMYIGYPDPANGGADAYPVYAMAGGRIVMVIRTSGTSQPLDYSLYIRHGSYVTSYFIHVHELSDRVLSHLLSTGAGWVDVPGAGSQIMFLGQNGAPARLPVAAGEELGRTRSYSHNWDVGVIDSRVTGAFVGRGPRRYPRLRDYLNLLGYPGIRAPFLGQQTLNAASFIAYLTPEHRSAWFNLLQSSPKRHGRAGWDLDGRLRGAWFNPAVDTVEPPPLFKLQSAAISVSPYNLAPLTKAQIGVAQDDSLAALDPLGQYPQLGMRIVVDIDPTPGARVNPNPAKVTPETGTVCYDVAYDDGGTPKYNSLLFHLTGLRRLAVKFDPVPRDASDCANRLGEEPDATWIVYRR